MIENTSSQAAEPQGPAVGSSTASAPSGARTSPNLLGSLGSAPAASGLGVMQNPAKPARKVNQALTAKRMITIGMLLPLFMLVMMPLVMTGMTSNISPRHVDVAVIGTVEKVGSVVDDLDRQTANDFDVSRVETVDDAKGHIEHHDIRAAYDPSSATLYLAGANGPQMTRATTALFTQVAQKSQQKLKTEDILPLAEKDQLGTTAMYLGLGATMGGFMAGLVLGLLPTASKWRVILGLVFPAVVATGLILYGWAVFGIFDGVAVGPWFMFYLLTFASLAVAMGGMLTVGPVMLPLAILLMPLLGMSTSGASMPLDMINPFYEAVHPWLFSGQGIWGIKNSIYFPDASLGQPILVMLIWSAVGILLAAVGTIRQKRLHLFHMNQVEEAKTVLSAAAVAV